LSRLFLQRTAHRKGERREQLEERRRRDGKAGGGYGDVDAKRPQNWKHRVISVDHTCTKCLHPAAAVAVTGEGEEKLGC
jgi:hypothetical protein